MVCDKEKKNSKQKTHTHTHTKMWSPASEISSIGMTTMRNSTSVSSGLCVILNTKCLANNFGWLNCLFFFIYFVFVGFIYFSIGFKLGFILFFFLILNWNFYLLINTIGKENEVYFNCILFKIKIFHLIYCPILKRFLNKLSYLHQKFLLLSEDVLKITKKFCQLFY